MRINHNIAALNTYSRLIGANFQQGKSLEKLSSGLRINKAGDDAAGLAISEKMRGQIRGLEQASRNSQDGISMIQTAEGALSETHSILQRMRELAVQAGNDTNTTADRTEIQKEINQLSGEINRIGNNTEFNTRKLLNGTLASTSSATGVTQATKRTAADNVQASFTISLQAATIACGTTFAWDGVTITAKCTVACLAANTFISRTCGISNIAANMVSSLNANSTFRGQWIASNNGDGSFQITALKGGAEEGVCANNNSLATSVAAKFCQTCTTVGVDATKQAYTLTFTSAAVAEGLKITVGDKTFALWDGSAGTYKDESMAKACLGATTVFNIANTKYDAICEIVCAIAACTAPTGAALDSDGAGAAVLTICATTAGTNGANAVRVATTGGSSSSAAGSGITLQIGANASQTFTAYFEDMRGDAINVTGTSSGGTYTTCDSKTAYYTSSACVTSSGSNQYALDVSTSTKATAAVSAIDDAIKQVSAERSKLGAYTNRLEHTVANLGASSENLTAAESRVRDVDMAKEMMEFTKNNILNQAATAMLAQANQQPQGVLQLLR